MPSVNRLTCHLHIKPTKDAEFIRVKVIVDPTGVSYQPLQ
jgi:hypothetical protein